MENPTACRASRCGFPCRNPEPGIMSLATLHIRKTFDPDQLRSILVASPNWLGDAVLALPALANLRRSLPAARISLLVRPWLSQLFRSSPFIDELVELPRKGELMWAAIAAHINSPL